MLRRIHSANSNSVIFPSASRMITAIASTGSATSSLLLMERKSPIARKPARLLPSFKGWFRTRPNPYAAASRAKSEPGCTRADVERAPGMLRKRCCRACQPIRHARPGSPRATEATRGDQSTSATSFSWLRFAVLTLLGFTCQSPEGVTVLRHAISALDDLPFNFRVIRSQQIFGVSTANSISSFLTFRRSNISLGRRTPVEVPTERNLSFIGRCLSG